MFDHKLHWEVVSFALIVGYLLGSIPFGLIFARLAGAGDIRKIGSGNVGATNVLRTGNEWAAALTLVCDIGKGALAVLVVHAFYGGDGAVFAGLGAFLGHLFPLWLGFKGGKGVAVSLGVVLALSWPAGLLVAATWLLAAAIWRISSLAALISAAMAPVFLFFLHQPLYAIFALILTTAIFVMHRENITRLLHHQEPRIGAKT